MRSAIASGWWLATVCFGIAAGCQVGIADEAPTEPVAATATENVGMQGDTEAPQGRLAEHQAMGVDRWENGLDSKLTSLFKRKATDVASPTIMLTALWNRKFSTDTFVGATISGLPQPHAEHKENYKDTGVKFKESYSLYYGGLNLAQGIFDSRPFRMVVQVGLGQGLIYVRDSPENLPSKVVTSKFRFVEPGLFFTFYDYQGLEIGAIATDRIARLEKKSETMKDSDLSAVSYGLTFRTQRW